MSNTLDLLIEAETLEQHLSDNNLLLVQISSREVFDNLHISNAQHIAPSELISGDIPARGTVPDIPMLNKLLQRIGFNGSQHFVVYDDEGGGWAGRFIWTLDYIGYNKYSYLNGGLHAWHAAQLPLQSGAAHVIKPSDFTITALNPQVRMQAQDILKRLGNSDFAIWDARSPAEYSGAQLIAQRGGHIPGAVNLEWTALMDKTKHLRLLPLSDIQHQLNNLGLSKDKTITTHCHSHHRSGLSYLVAKILNYPDIRAYDGSWSDWGNNAQLPVEN